MSRYLDLKFSPGYKEKKGTTATEDSMMNYIERQARAMRHIHIGTSLREEVHQPQPDEYEYEWVNHSFGEEVATIHETDE
jgi:hypothetical protein